MGCNKIRKPFRFTLYTFSRAGFKVDGKVRGSKWRSANCTRCLKRGCVLGKLRTTVDLAHSAPRNLASRLSPQQSTNPCSNITAFDSRTFCVGGTVQYFAVLT